MDRLTSNIYCPIPLPIIVVFVALISPSTTLASAVDCCIVSASDWITCSNPCLSLPCVRTRIPLPVDRQHGSSTYYTVHVSMDVVVSVSYLLPRVVEDVGVFCTEPNNIKITLMTFFGPSNPCPLWPYTTQSLIQLSQKEANCSYDCALLITLFGYVAALPCKFMLYCCAVRDCRIEELRRK